LLPGQSNTLSATLLRSTFGQIPTQGKAPFVGIGHLFGLALHSEWRLAIVLCATVTSYSRRDTGRSACSGFTVFPTRFVARMPEMHAWESSFNAEMQANLRVLHQVVPCEGPQMATGAAMMLSAALCIDSVQRWSTTASLTQLLHTGIAQQTAQAQAQQLLSPLVG